MSTELMQPEEIELFVHGVFLGPHRSRPVLVLKGKTDDEVLPVWLSRNEIDSYSTEANQVLRGSYFHKITGRLLKELGLRLERCRFVSLVGHHQYVDLHLVGKRSGRVVQVRAEEAMALCLATGTRFFATLDFMEKCRYMNQELTEAGLAFENGREEILNPYLN